MLLRNKKFPIFREKKIIDQVSQFQLKKKIIEMK